LPERCWWAPLRRGRGSKGKCDFHQLEIAKRGATKELARLRADNKTLQAKLAGIEKEDGRLRAWLQYMNDNMDLGDNLQDAPWLALEGEPAPVRGPAGEG